METDSNMVSATLQKPLLGWLILSWLLRVDVSLLIKSNIYSVKQVAILAWMCGMIHIFWCCNPKEGMVIKWEVCDMMRLKERRCEATWFWQLVGQNKSAQKAINSWWGRGLNQWSWQNNICLHVTGRENWEWCCHLHHLAPIYDVYTTFHIAVYIPTLIKQLMPHNSMNNCVVE